MYTVVEPAGAASAVGAVGALDATTLGAAVASGVGAFR